MGLKRTTKDKFYEKVSPTITWISILFPFVGGLLFPEVTAYFVILFNIYFLYKSISFAILFIIGLLKLREAESVSWMSRLEELTDIPAAIQALRLRFDEIRAVDYAELRPSINSTKFKQFPRLLKRLLYKREKAKISKFIRTEIERLEHIKELGVNVDWRDVRHIVIIPHWKEPHTVLEETIKHLVDQTFPTKQMSIVMAAEARDAEGIEKSHDLKAKYGKHFEHFWVTVHELTEDEIIGKSSNMNYAGRWVAGEIKKLGWDLKKTTISSCDADSLFPREYFANMTYLYATLENAIYKTFNAAILFYSNIWKLPFYARVKNSLSSVYNVTKLVRTDKFIPFSTYTASFWLIDQIGYWDPWVTPEDYHLHFKALFKFQEKVSTVPVFQRIMSDAAEGQGHWDTIKNNYFQSRRWNWGASDDGWMLQQTVNAFWKGTLTWHVFYRVIRVLYGHTIDITTSLIVAIGGNVPLIINKTFSGTVLGVNVPRISSFMVRFTFIFLFSIIILDGFMLKPDPGYKLPWYRRIFYFAEWVSLPFVGYFLSIAPGIDAHTRLLFGKYMEYYLTKKQERK